MIAVDTNVLIYAHRTESAQHERALAHLTRLAEGLAPWAVPVFCIAEFVRVVTHRRIFTPPSTLEQAMAFVDGILGSPSVRLLLPTASYPRFFAEACQRAGASGNLAFIAQIAAVCRENGVDRILTADRDFLRLPGLSTQLS